MAKEIWFAADIREGLVMEAIAAKAARDASEQDFIRWAQSLPHEGAVIAWRWDEEGRELSRYVG